MKTKAMSRPGAVLDLMDQLREASTKLGHAMLEGKGSRAEAEFGGELEPRVQISPSGPAKDFRLKQQPDALFVTGAFACAEVVFGDSEAAMEWLREECLGLNFDRPIDLLTDAQGLSRVLVLLSRIQSNAYT